MKKIRWALATVAGVIFALSLQFENAFGSEATDAVACNDISPSFKTPQMKKPVAPKYPMKIMKLGPTPHRVFVKFCVSNLGKTSNIEIIKIEAKGQVFDEFGQASVRAVEKWTYAPASLEGKPVSVCGCETKFSYCFDGQDCSWD